MNRALVLIALILLGCDRSPTAKPTPAANKPGANDPAAVAALNAMPATREKLARAKDLDRPESERAAILKAVLDNRNAELHLDEASAALNDLCETDPGRQAARATLIPYLKTRAAEIETDDALWQNKGRWQALLDHLEKIVASPN